MQAGAIFGVSVSLADTVGTYGAFEESMSNVKAISGATGEEFEKLTAKAKEEGATTKFTAKDSADAFGYMAMAGWKTEDMLNGIDGIMSLAAASNEDLATTSDIVTDALTAFGLQASDSGHFADVLAQASANANTNVGINALSGEIEVFEKSMDSLDNQLARYRAMEKDAKTLAQDHVLTAELIERLIERIEIDHERNIHVTFRFKNEFQGKAVEPCTTM